MLTDVITQVHIDSHGIYGARRVHAELTLGRGVEVGHNQVELLMRRAGLQGVTGRRKWKRTLPDNRAMDLVERQFTRAGPNQLWVTDITEHPTTWIPSQRRQGLLLRRSRHLLSQSRWLVHRCLTQRCAGDQRTWHGHRHASDETSPTGTVIHSDQGVQFGSWVFTQRAKASGLLASMGSIGDCLLTG
ncbi:IS3 family transposase [Tessaracoccus sp.]